MIQRYLFLPPFIIFQTGQCILVLDDTRHHFFFFFSFLHSFIFSHFEAMLASSTATRSEKSLPRAGRRVRVTRFMPLQGERRCPPVPASRSLAVSGYLKGADRSRRAPPGDGERKSRAWPPHCLLTSSLAPVPRPTATGGTDLPTVAAPRKGVHNTGPGPGRAKGEPVGISLC